MKKLLIVFLLLLPVVWMACSEQPKPCTEQVKQYYLSRINSLDSALQQLKKQVTANAPEAEMQRAFLNARLAYKSCEVFSEYYQSVTSKALNGAPIPSMDENDQHRIDNPTGFQVAEPFLFPNYDAGTKQALLAEVDGMLSNLIRLKQLARAQELADARVFDALRNEVFRIITLGISGFDAAIAQNSMAEADASLSSISKVLQIYEAGASAEQKALYNETQDMIVAAQKYLKYNRDFNSFNRLYFITRYANNLSGNMVKLTKANGVKSIGDLRAVKADAVSLFEIDAFEANFNTSGFDAHMSKEKVELGKRLFYDAVLGGGARSCATCHRPELAFTDGLIKNRSLDGHRDIRRNTPTLLNAGFQSALFYDNRVSYLEDQATEVINNADEMHGSLPAAVKQLKADTAYRQLFGKAFKGGDVTEYNLRNALGSYIRSLVSLNSPFDKYVRGDHSQLNANEIKGFNLFMGKAKCGTCHFTPLFNGNVPPDFRNTDTEVIGVPVSATINTIDTDKGRYDLRKLKLYENAFRTPTVRNISLTAPYMHNGIYKTLEEVVDFYNNGGGSGLHIELNNQTLPFDKLNLSKQEKKDIVAFLKKLTDTSAAIKLAN
jgi:cytochrome c peroxidase